MRLQRILLYLLVALSPTTSLGCYQPQLVLYCAQDEEFAKDILASFKQEAGIEVAPKFDTEADKSVSLFTEIVREKQRPRCDVFWNNEVLSTIRLQKQGLLLPYDSPSAKPYPASAKADDHSWHAFATRPRILIVNTDFIVEMDRPHSLFDLTKEKWKNQTVMSRPQFGTSATQAACLFEVLGAEKARDYYTGLKHNGIHISPGNKQVAEWVAQGKTPTGERVFIGVTDPDDALEEINHGKPVMIIFPDRDAMGKLGTLFIPNTLAILKGAPHPEQAKKLVDYLLSPAVEAKLAESESHQVPLNPQVKSKLPKEFEGLDKVKRMDVDFVKAAGMWDEVQEFLRGEFAR